MSKTSTESAQTLAQLQPKADALVGRLVREAEAIAGQVVRHQPRRGRDWDRILDDVVTSPWTGFPIMLLILGAVFWITIVGANVPSAMLADLFFAGEDVLVRAFQAVGAPAWLYGFLVNGVYRGLGWVISVMLPPMMIFFPIFTLLEDFGYLPRVAFNLDGLFRRAGAHGKQSLTMAMGFGCNAAGVIACRIIESPRERMIAIITNNFVPCNGRWPTLITLASLFLVGGAVATGYSSLAAAAAVTSLTLVGIAVTVAASWALSRTLLRGMASTFTLELPPYRPPQVAQVFVRSVFDRTLFVLYRAIKVAAPAGGITWLLANIHIGGASLLAHTAAYLDPFGHALGLDGIILMAFILGFPANEIVLPIMTMGYMAAGTMVELDSLAAFRTLLVSNGWTWLTALNMTLFSVLHYPCGTTVQTIFKETGSGKWTAISVALPLGIALGVTFLVAQAARLVGWA